MLRVYRRRESLELNYEISPIYFGEYGANSC
jgi:hypothetical protein